MLLGCRVDVAVHMPSKCFLEKDYLNGKHLGHRAAYLHHLASALRKKKLGYKQQSWDVQDQDAR